MVFDAKPDWPPTPSFLRLYVKDGDATFEREDVTGDQMAERAGDPAAIRAMRYVQETLDGAIVARGHHR